MKNVSLGMHNNKHSKFELLKGIDQLKEIGHFRKNQEYFPLVSGENDITKTYFDRSNSK